MSPEKTLAGFKEYLKEKHATARDGGEQHLYEDALLVVSMYEEAA